MMQTAAGISAPIRQLVASLLALGRIRLELLAIEVQEETERAASLLLWAVLTALMTGFGAVFVAVFVTVALWDSHRLAALGGAALLFVAVGVYGVLRLRRLIGAPPTLFQSSIVELRRDGAELSRAPPP